MSGKNPLPTVKRGAVDTHCHLFLLEREPNTSILRSFDVDVIGTYFPEFRDAIRRP